MNNLLLSAVLAAVFPIAATADEFTDLAARYGTTLTIGGMSQVTTNNPDGTPINFWQPAFEGANVSTIALSNPHMMGADAYGNRYVADKSSHSVLKIAPTGIVHTLAGTHVAGFNGDGPAPGNTLQLNNTNGLFVLPNGTVYIYDPGNHRIRRVTPDGVMTTVINDPDPRWFPSGRGLWVSPDERLIYYTQEYSPVPPSIISDGAVVKKWTPAGGIEIVCPQSTGFLTPGNIDVNPVGGKLYVTDRAEHDTTNVLAGVFRIDAPGVRIRVTGNVASPLATDGQAAVNSFLEQPRGIAFLANGAWFVCGHKDGSIWYVDTAGIMHRYLRGLGKRDAYSLPNGAHPPLVNQTYFAQPRCVIIGPNGDLLVVCNDSGFLFSVNFAASPTLPSAVNPAWISGSGLRLQWTGVYGRASRIERSSSLGPGSWEPVGAVPGLPAGQLSEFTDAGALSRPSAFYRLLPSK